MAESLRYKDKVTIVTGGSKGIGRGCVEVFGMYTLYYSIFYRVTYNKRLRLIDMMSY